MYTQMPSRLEPKTPFSSRKNSQAQDGQFNLIDEGQASEAAQEEGDFTTAIAHYLDKAKGEVSRAVGFVG